MFRMVLETWREFGIHSYKRFKYSFLSCVLHNWIGILEFWLGETWYELCHQISDFEWLLNCLVKGWKFLSSFTQFSTPNKIYEIQFYGSLKEILNLGDEFRFFFLLFIEFFIFQCHSLVHFPWSNYVLEFI